MVYIKRNPKLDHYLQSIHYKYTHHEKDFISTEAFHYAKQFVHYSDLKTYLEVKHLPTSQVPFETEAIVFTSVYQASLDALNVVKDSSGT